MADNWGRLRTRTVFTCLNRCFRIIGGHRACGKNQLMSEMKTGCEWNPKGSKQHEIPLDTLAPRCLRRPIKETAPSTSPSGYRKQNWLLSFLPLCYLDRNPRRFCSSNLISVFSGYWVSPNVYVHFLRVLLLHVSSSTWFLIFALNFRKKNISSSSHWNQINISFALLAVDWYEAQDHLNRINQAPQELTF